MASTFYDRVKVGVTAAPGTGTISLGSAVAGFRTFASASIPDQAQVSYVIEDGTSWECGRGTYTASGATLTRNPVVSSAGTATAISATANAVVYVALLAEDLAQLAGSGSAAVAPAVVQAAMSVNVTVTMTNTPVAGNMLIAFVSHNNNSALIGTGWSTFHPNTGWIYDGSTDGLLVAFKIAGSAESKTQQPVQSTNQTNGNLLTAVWEVSNLNPKTLASFEASFQCPNFEANQSLVSAKTLSAPIFPENNGLLLMMAGRPASGAAATMSGGGLTYTQDATAGSTGSRYGQMFHAPTTGYGPFNVTATWAAAQPNILFAAFLSPG